MKPMIDGPTLELADNLECAVRELNVLRSALNEIKQVLEGRDTWNPLCAIQRSLEIVYATRCNEN